MAKLYTNENFDFAVVIMLRELGHDVLTSKDADNANKGIPDDEVLAFATTNQRIVVTFNYQDFKKLHRKIPEHGGIIICTEDKDLPALAQRIHAALEVADGQLSGQLIRINRPNPSSKP